MLCPMEFVVWLITMLIHKSNVLSFKDCKTKIADTSSVRMIFICNENHIKCYWFKTKHAILNKEIVLSVVELYVGIHIKHQPFSQ